MRWIVVAVAALAAVVVINVGLLTYGGDRHDPVGRLSPVASLPQPTTPAPRTVPHEQDD